MVIEGCVSYHAYAYNCLHISLPLLTSRRGVVLRENLDGDVPCSDLTLDLCICAMLKKYTLVCAQG